MYMFLHFCKMLFLELLYIQSPHIKMIQVTKTLPFRLVCKLHNEVNVTTALSLYCRVHMEKYAQVQIQFPLFYRVSHNQIGSRGAVILLRALLHFAGLQ